MPSSRQCAECGAPLPDDLPDGSCAVCAFRGALGLSDECAEAGGAEKPGDHIGRYRLLEKIGEGGYGVVYIAEQAEPIRRQVALKVIKLGLDTKQVIARFEAERQALALMDHPNIARVLDAGATDTGRPYFVMELVQGIRITDYCNLNKLSTGDRLDLFIKVCHAIQHAHQKGIIHRDIKPSNILVAQHDGAPVPKIIDFGIAKATQQSLTQNTPLTGFQQFIGTPAYMSPEQAEMTGEDIDTRSDIYTAGVLLYELLTGHTPFESMEFLQAGFDEMRRIIREKEPPKPSTRLSSLNAADLTTVAQYQRTEAPRLVHLVRGDLDWIVMKCLEKDRARRYATANDLARDLERHLSHEPVTAAAPNAFYRAGKFVRRHRVVLATVTALALLLAGGVIASLWQAMRAKKAEHEARLVAAFLQDMLNSVRPDVALGRDTTLLREVLDKAARRLDEELRDHPEAQADLLVTIGRAYSDLGDYRKANIMLRRALDIYSHLFGARHARSACATLGLAHVALDLGRIGDADRLSGQALQTYELLGGSETNLARALVGRAVIMEAQGKLAEAERTLRKVLAMETKLRVSEDSETGTTLGIFAALLMKEGKMAEAEPILRRVLSTQRRRLGKEHPNVATSLNNLAWALFKQGKSEEADQLVREALAMHEHLFGKAHPENAPSLNNLALSLRRQGKLREAETLLRDTLALQKKALGEKHPALGSTLNNLALVLNDQHKPATSEALLREALAMQEKVLGKEHPDVGMTLNILALVLKDQGRFTAAESLYREALRIRKKLSAEGYPGTAETLDALADLFSEQNRPANAEPMAREALALRKKLLGNEHGDVVESLGHLASILEQQERLSEAESLCREAYSIVTKKPGQEQVTISGCLNNLGMVLERQGKLIEAEAMVREALGISKRTQKQHAFIVIQLNNLAGIVSKQGKLAEAEAMLREALAMQKQLHGPEHETVGDALYALAQVLVKQNKFSEVETVSCEAIMTYRNLAKDTQPKFFNALLILANALLAQDRLLEAEVVYREALTLGRELLGNEDLNVARCLHNLGAALGKQGKLVEAETVCREALAIREKLLGNESPDVAESLKNLSGVLYQQSKFAEAEPLFRRILALRTKLFGSEHPDVADSLESLGTLLENEGKFAEAEARFREALAMRQKLFGPSHKDVAASLSNIGAAIKRQGRLSEAEAFFRESLALDEKLSGKPSRDALQMRNLSSVLFEEGRGAEAEEMIRKALSAARDSGNPRDPEVFHALGLLAVVLATEQKLPESEAAVREALALQKVLDPREVREEGIGGALILQFVLRLQGKLAEEECQSLSLNLVFTQFGLSRENGMPDFEKEIETLTQALHKVRRKEERALLLFARGSLFGQQGQWQAATKALVEVASVDQEAPVFALAPLLVETGDESSYLQFRRRLFLRFSRSEDPATAAETAMAMSLREGDSVWSSARRFSGMAVTTGTHDARLPYFQLVKGTTEYRDNRFADAAEWARKSLANSATNFTTAVAAEAVLAMAQQKLAQSAAATQSLAHATEIFETKLPRLESRDLGENWSKWLIAHILLDEASALIQKK